jgi:inactivated superfamily I helicase
MRLELGLDLPERRIGLSAHDFAQLLGMPEVFLTRATKVRGAPTVASRFTQPAKLLPRRKQRAMVRPGTLERVGNVRHQRDHGDGGLAVRVRPQERVDSLAVAGF